MLWQNLRFAYLPRFKNILSEASGTYLVMTCFCNVGLQMHSYRLFAIPILDRVSEADRSQVVGNRSGLNGDIDAAIMPQRW